MPSPSGPSSSDDPTAAPRRGRDRRWRRKFTLGLVCLLTVGTGSVALATGLRGHDRLGDALGPAASTRFDNALQIPPLAPSRVDSQGRRVFDLTAQTGTTELVPGRRSPTWGVNGSHLGPTLRAKRGETVMVRVRNALPEATTMHWHGMNVPAKMDGGPHQKIAPGTTWSPTWQIDQPAATLWYHPHPHGATAKHIYRGVYGMFIIDDDSTTGGASDDATDATTQPEQGADAATDEDTVGAPALPHDYGVDDLPVMVQDVSFDDDGQLDERAGKPGPTGRLGRTILVNGTRTPYQEVTTQRVRLRLLNASAARVYNFGFSDDRSYSVVGSDNGLLAAPVRTTRIQLSPGERAEVVVTVRPGERTTLRSYPPDLGDGSVDPATLGGSDRFDILQLRAAPRLQESPTVPEKLADLPAANLGDVVAERRFELSGVTINGRLMDAKRVDATVTGGTTEMWSVVNLDAIPHNFHVHGVRFRVVDVDGRDPPAELDGWKDTVFVKPGSTARLLITFPKRDDPNEPYMFHCHLLQHEDLGMMGQFVVVAPGQQADLADHHH